MKIGDPIRHGLQACKTCPRVSFTKKAGCHRTTANLQSGDCGKITLEKAQGKLQKMEIRQQMACFTVRPLPLPLLSVLRPPPGF